MTLPISALIYMVVACIAGAEIEPLLEWGRKRPLELGGDVIQERGRLE